MFTTTTFGNRHAPSRMLAGLALATVLIVAVGLAQGLGGSDTASPTSGGSAARVSTETPSGVLPSDGAPPITWVGGTELTDADYYDYLPDVHLTWREVPGGTDICWRTAEGSACVSDDFADPGTVVVPVGDEVVVLTRPAWIPDPAGGIDPATGQVRGTYSDPTTITVQFSDGTSADASVTVPDGIAVGYARFDVPSGAEVASAAAS